MAKRNGSRPAQAATAEAPAATQPVEQARNRPVHEVRLGRVRASVWRNTNSKQETWFSVVLTRGYKDNEGAWKNSHSLGLDDLLVAGEVLRQAALWIYAERQGEHRTAQPQANGATEAQEGVHSDIPFDQQSFPASDPGPYSERM